MVRDLAGEDLAVDGFNSLSILRSAMRGETLLLGLDGFVRDLSACVRRVRVGPDLMSALNPLLRRLSELGVRRVVFVYDSQVSWSALMARATERMIGMYGLRGEAVLARRADKRSLGLGMVVCSSDSVLLDRAERLSDVVSALALTASPAPVVDFIGLVSAYRPGGPGEEALAQGAEEAQREDGAEGEGARGGPGGDHKT